MSTASEKREEVKVKLQGLRKALRVMHAGVLEETVLPHPGDFELLWPSWKPYSNS
ncbi:hypothetical protein PMIT1342_00536 [Prochlorococcus marinus str. MIT 1342]|uniref:hypothetical protein n=1 Tax=Prochlorococcus TaxID=1218 RepID=UPI0007BB299C|nr:hypothetical protein [Prochlorococcus marinus]KZR82885.1 hypothetical protein PMIT1342_00536 [Prochlorococcus marinus str. MIT 1342]